MSKQSESCKLTLGWKCKLVSIIRRILSSSPVRILAKSLPRVTDLVSDDWAK